MRRLIMLYPVMHHADFTNAVLTAKYQKVSWYTRYYIYVYAHDEWSAFHAALFNTKLTDVQQTLLHANFLIRL